MIDLVNVELRKKSTAKHERTNNSLINYKSLLRIIVDVHDIYHIEILYILFCELAYHHILINALILRQNMTAHISPTETIGISTK